MLRFHCKCLSLTQIKIAEKSQTHLFVALLKSQSFGSTSVSTCSNSRSSSYIRSSSEQKSSFSVGDLIKSRGLARQISYSSSNPVVALLESYGFLQTQIETIASRYPRILTYDAESTIKPKIDFFRSVTSEADVVDMITKKPRILTGSLKNRIIPLFDLLRTLLGGKETAVYAIKRFPFVFSYDVLKNLEPNLSTLKFFGVPESQISKLMFKWGMLKVTVGTPNYWFSKAVEAVLKMGFDPCSSSFAHAVNAMALHNTVSNWERKLGVYRSLGFSDKEIISMFRKQPHAMSLSEEKTREAAEFYVNKFRWSPSHLSARPNVLIYSFEKRIIPRCSVLQLLVSRGRIHKNVRVLTILCSTEKDFVGRYVTKYKDEFPEVLDAYRGKLKFDEYNFDSGELRG